MNAENYMKAVENLIKKVQSGQVDANDLYSKLLVIASKYAKGKTNGKS